MTRMLKHELYELLFSNKANFEKNQGTEVLKP